MTFNEYRQYDALGLAELIRKGEINANDLLELAIKRASEVNPQINAIVYEMYDMAKEMSKASLSGPFAGVPFLIKDLEIHINGVRTQSGCRGLKDFVSPEDGVLTHKLRKAGFVFMGKTNTPEFGLTPFTESELYGPCRNPWNTDHSPGGSSGGSAAAVSAGIVPLATASDGGGSIRIPASCCGLFGLKPSRGRVSLGNLNAEAWGGAVVENCVSRSVRDSAAYLDAVHGYAPGDPYFIQSPIRPYLEEVKTEPGQLKIGFSTTHTLGHQTDKECIKAVDHAIQLLKSLGHSVEEVELPFDREYLTEVFFTMVLGEMSVLLDLFKEVTGRAPKANDFELNTMALCKLGGLISAREFAGKKRQWNVICRRMADFHQKYDCLLTPVLGTPPSKIGALKNTPTENRLLKTVVGLGLGKLLIKNLEPLVDKAFSYIPYTPIANMTGQPGMSVPLHWSDDGLPIGVMFTGRMGEEDLLYRLAGQLERAQPWFDKIPSM